MTASPEILKSILMQYGFSESPVNHEVFLRYTDERTAKLIIGVTLTNGRRLVVKLMRDAETYREQGVITENQSAFSELLRAHGIRTPRRYQARGRYCIPTVMDDLPYHTTLEDFCGYELTEIRTDIAYKLGVLMARMHTISLDSGFCIGRRTIFNGAGDNDVGAYPDFCRICKEAELNQTVVTQIKELYEQKLARIRAQWTTLPTAATQGDLSINNLTMDKDGELTVFDYNIAGDEVLVSDMVLEGLFVAYQMDLPQGCSAAYRETIFPAFYEGYLSVRSLTEAECAVAWDLFTMYHALWGSRVDELDILVSDGNHEQANELLMRIFSDLCALDDGRFRV